MSSGCAANVRKASSSISYQFSEPNSLTICTDGFSSINYYRAKAFKCDIGDKKPAVCLTDTEGTFHILTQEQQQQYKCSTKNGN